VELQLRTVTERLKAENMKLLQFEQR
jgi:hypothetical protein